MFQWNFPLLGTYWTAADIILQHIAKKEGGSISSRARRSRWSITIRLTARPIALLQKRAELHGFETMLLPVTHPGVEQKATWLQIRQSRPDYVLLWGWGVMNSTSIKEAVAVGYPREKMYGVWWSGAEPDVRPAEDGSKGYNSVTLQHTAGQFKLHEDLKKHVYDKNQGSAKWEETGEILYVRGLIDAIGVEPIRTAQKKFGKKPLTGEQVRWGFENLDITADRIKQLGFEGVLQPIKVSCADHEGARTGRIQTWDGKNWKITSDWYTSDDSVIAPMVKDAAAKYAAERKSPRLPDELMTVQASSIATRGGVTPPSFRYGTAPDRRRGIARRPDPLGQQHRGGLRPRHPGASKASRSRSPKGEIVALLGANGAGKSTTLKAISNLLAAERGEVTKARSCSTAPRCTRLRPASWCGAAASR